MIAPELPENETERLRQLRSYGLLDTGGETAYDNLTRLAATVCGSGVSAISFIEADKQWVKSCFGADLKEIPRSLSICGHVINNAQGEILEIPDTSKDERFFDNPLITQYKAFSYFIGVPIFDKEGYALGSLCVINETFLKINEQQKESLRIIAQQVGDQLELQKAKLEVSTKDKQHMDLLNKVDDAIYELDARGNYLFVNSKTCQMLGLTEAELKERVAFDFVHPDDLERVTEYHQGLFLNQDPSGYYEMTILPYGRPPVRIGQKVSLDYRDGKLIKIRAIARELSEVNRLKRALQDRENQYKILSENSRDVIGVHAMDGSYKHISHAAWVAMGYAPKDVLGKVPRDFIHPDDLNGLKDKLRSLVKGEVEMTNFECRIRKANGDYLWMEVYTRVIIDGQGKIDGFHSSARDISERKHNENQVSLLIENTTDAVWAVDKDLRFIYFNSVFQELHFRRMGREVKIGAKLQPEKVGANLEKDFGFLLKALNGVKGTEEIRFYIDDEFYVMDNSATPMVNEADEVTGVSIFSRNITSQFQEKQRVYNYQVGLKLLNDLAVKTLPTAELLEHALQSICEYLDMPIGVISRIIDGRYDVAHFVDPADRMDWKPGMDINIEGSYSELTFRNQSVVLVDQGSKADYGGHPCFRDQKRVKSYIGAPVMVDDQFYGTVEFVSEKGRKEIFGDQDGEFMKLFANWIGSVLTKESSYKILEREKERAEEASIAKADFLSMMSHEVRTPLNGIIGTTHLLLKKNPSPEQLPKLNILKKSSDHLLAIVTDILDFAKIEEGKILLENAEFNLRELLDALCVNYQTLIEEKGIALKLEYDNDLHANYWGDQVRLNQIFHNLVNNAIKFTEQGSVVIRCQRLNKVNTFDQIRVEVSDTGIGISEENIKAIFGVFSQAEKSITRRFGGSGLGLSITKRLLELMDSEIKVESVREQGTTFSFDLALKRGSGISIQKTVREEEKKENLQGNILIVEDNIFNRVIAKDFAESRGLKVFEAENGREALTILRNKEIDLVLLDIQMPIMDGYETVVWIREQEEGYFQDLPVIALTASAMVEVQNKVYRCGMNDFLTKPFVPDDFYKKIELHLSLRDRPNEEISLDYLSDILKNDTDKMKRFFDLFIESVTHDYQVYERALENKVFMDIYQLTRKNRPTLKSLGLHRLARQAKVIEKMIEHENPNKMIIREAQNHLYVLKSTVNKIILFRESLKQAETNPG